MLSADRRQGPAVLAEVIQGRNRTRSVVFALEELVESRMRSCRGREKAALSAGRILGLFGQAHLFLGIGEIPTVQDWEFQPLCVF